MIGRQSDVKKSSAYAERFGAARAGGGCHGCTTTRRLPEGCEPLGELMLHISVNILTIQVLAIASTQPPQNCWPPVAMEVQAY